MKNFSINKGLTDHPENQSSFLIQQVQQVSVGTKVVL